MAATGFLIGLFALAGLGMTGTPSERLSDWYLTWFGVAGVVLTALCFLVWSIVALRNRERAGRIFLCVTPIAAFCLAYSASETVDWHTDGSGWPAWAPPFTALGLAALFYLPFLAPVLARRRRTLSAVLFADAVILAAIVFEVSRLDRGLVPQLAGWSIFFLTFGLFWWRTAHRDWPALLQPRPQNVWRKLAAGVLLCCSVLCLDATLTVVRFGLGSSLFSGNCRTPAPYVHQRNPNHALFTARIVLVGRSIEGLTRDGGIFRDPYPGISQELQVGDWAIGVVQERFWGLPTWGPRLVLLTNLVYWKGETYLIDGMRAAPSFPTLLPVVKGGAGCSRTRPVGDAIVDLRLLHQPPSTGTRLIGYVRPPVPFKGVFTRPVPSHFVAGAQIRISGPDGTRIVSTDPSGVYQIDGLPTGEYKLTLLRRDDQVVGMWGDASTATVHLDNREPVEHNFELFWNGSIEGRVEDESGKPAQVSMMLLKADGQMPGYVKFFQPNKSDGFYQISQIPPGRYRVLINPSGPYDGSPFGIQYYPSTLRPAEARVFEVAEGQQIKGVDFRAPRLPQRSVEVQVHWPGGRRVAGAFVCLAYEHTDYYEKPACMNFVKITDQDGGATIHLYGNSGVLLFAVHDVENKPGKQVFSHKVEAAASNMPGRVNMVLDSGHP